MIYAFTENFVLPLSHDEVVHGKRSLLEKMPGDDWQKFANLRLLFGYLFAHPGKKLLFMGSELAERNEFWEEGSVDWSLEESPSHRGVQRLLADLNRLHATSGRSIEVDFEWAGFEWIDANDAAASILSFIRRARNPEDYVVVVAISRQYCGWTFVSASRGRDSTGKFSIAIRCTTKAATPEMPEACAPNPFLGTTGLGPSNSRSRRWPPFISSRSAISSSLPLPH